MQLCDDNSIISSSFDATVVNFAQNKILPRGEVRGRLSGHTSKAVRCLDGAPQSRPSVMGMIINRAKCVTGSPALLHQSAGVSDAAQTCQPCARRLFTPLTGTVFFSIYAFATGSNSTFPFHSWLVTRLLKSQVAQETTLSWTLSFWHSAHFLKDKIH